MHFRARGLLAKVRTFSPKVTVNKLTLLCTKNFQSAAPNSIMALNLAQL